MPKEMEKKLMAEAKKKGMKGKRMNAYVYGTMRKAGWTPSIKRKGRKNKINKK